ncbi:hypothetical protein [Jhaorihella thermophila]|uniref:Uncharacterized protein n=1 Tax=Jhaorihella thermophila TaxID=488547 RepID=A0A1H5S691_9RHOB|nr:hypothetical protein [Jhaorihella thermophila]SEF45291.1 hypothetical protein SAMN05421751_101328 [Jhaorihella thermophila]
MLDTAIDITLVVTLCITGFYAVIFVRDPQAAMETATHRLDLLPRVMAGRYVVVFLFTLGVSIHFLVYRDAAVAAWFYAVCAFLGLHDGWVYRRHGLPHFKHTITGLLALGALCITVLALATSGDAV